MHCDLHMHSVFSDGSDTPQTLIRKAKELDLVVALTDHNTVSGLPDFIAEAQAQGVTAVAGIEFTTVWENVELHLLGLFVPPEHYRTLERVVKEYHVLKEISNMEMVERLNEAGYAIDYASIKRRNPDGNANRAHVAAELMEKGYVQSIGEAFRELLAEDKGFYVPAARLQTTEAIGILREICAVPVLAHPLLDLTQEQLHRALPELVEAGLVGMEVQHCTYDAAAIALAKQIADTYGLLHSGGSDYHGTAKPDVAIGVGKGNLQIPVKVYEDLAQYQKTMKKPL